LCQRTTHLLNESQIYSNLSLFAIGSIRLKPYLQRMIKAYGLGGQFQLRVGIDPIGLEINPFQLSTRQKSKIEIKFCPNPNLGGFSSQTDDIQE